MSRIIIDVGEERKRKMNRLIKGKDAKFKSYNEMIRRLLDEYFESIQLENSQLQQLQFMASQIPLSKGKILIKQENNGASAYLDNTLLINKVDLKDLIFYLWENFKGYKLEFEGIKPQDYVFATFSHIKCWDMFSIEDQHFPIVPVEVQYLKGKMALFAQVDTASSIILLDISLKPMFKVEKLGVKTIMTPLGKKDFETYLLEYKIEDISIKCQTIFVDFPDVYKKLNIQALIGENLLKHKNLLVLYLRNTTCLSD